MLKLGVSLKASFWGTEAGSSNTYISLANQPREGLFSGQNEPKGGLAYLGQYSRITLANTAESDDSDVTWAFSPQTKKRLGNSGFFYLGMLH